MNRSELVERVADQAGLDRRTAERAVDAFCNAVMEDAKSGNKTTLFGFGTFTPTSRAARMGRNPQTGEAVRIAASKGVRFAPASAFKSLLNPGGSKAGAAKKGAVKKGAAKKTTAKKASAKKAPAKKAAKSTAKATKSAKRR